MCSRGNADAPPRVTRLSRIVPLSRFEEIDLETDPDLCFDNVALYDCKKYRFALIMTLGHMSQEKVTRVS